MDTLSSSTQTGALEVLTKFVALHGFLARAASPRLFRCDFSGEAAGRQVQSMGRVLMLRDDWASAMKS